jgi:DcrB
MRAVLLALVAAIAVALAGCGSSDEQKTVTGSGYSFAVPSGWSDVTKQAKSITAGATSPDTAVAGKRQDRFTPNVNTVIEPVPGRLSAATYASRAKAALKAAGGSVTTPSITTPTKVDGEPAAGVEVERQQEGRNLRAAQVYTIKNGRAYVITYTALPAKFKAQSSSFREVLDSWGWKYAARPLAQRSRSAMIPPMPPR